MDVVLEPDATPLVRIIATTLRDSTADADVARKAERLRGVFALRSEKDPQAVSMRFDRGRGARARLDLLGELGVRPRPPRRQGVCDRIPSTRVGADRQLPRVDDARRAVTPDELGTWLDENRITTVRTEGPSLDGLVLGKHLS